jgi:hypothetical protein
VSIKLEVRQRSTLQLEAAQSTCCTLPQKAHRPGLDLELLPELLDMLSSVNEDLGS